MVWWDKKEGKEDAKKVKKADTKGHGEGVQRSKQCEVEECDKPSEVNKDEMIN